MKKLFLTVVMLMLTTTAFSQTAQQNFKAFKFFPTANFSSTEAVLMQVATAATAKDLWQSWFCIDPNLCFATTEEKYARVIEIIKGTRKSDKFPTFAEASLLRAALDASIDELWPYGDFPIDTEEYCVGDLCATCVGCPPTVKHKYFKLIELIQDY
jgi:hypothetical protein